MSHFLQNGSTRTKSRLLRRNPSATQFTLENNQFGLSVTSAGNEDIEQCVKQLHQILQPWQIKCASVQAVGGSVTRESRSDTYPTVDDKDRLQASLDGSTVGT
ncbi:hypothetical protein IWQ62_005998, partial [Dispira parvispora]